MKFQKKLVKCQCVRGRNEIQVCAGPGSRGVREVLRSRRALFSDCTRNNKRFCVLHDSRRPPQPTSISAPDIGEWSSVGFILWPQQLQTDIHLLPQPEPELDWTNVANSKSQPTALAGNRTLSRALVTESVLQLHDY